MRIRIILTTVMLPVMCGLFIWLSQSTSLDSVNGQESKPTLESQTKSGGTPLALPRPDFHFPGNVGRTILDSDKPMFPQPVQPPKGAPNVVLILLDDTGFGQYETFGGGIRSPTIKKLADEGLRYNRFHTTALCSPTRAALI